MQKSFAELTSLLPATVSQLLTSSGEPLLVTDGEEPQFVALSLASFERMVRRLRVLEADREKQTEGENARR